MAFFVDDLKAYLGVQLQADASASTLMTFDPLHIWYDYAPMYANDSGDNKVKIDPTATRILIESDGGDKERAMQGPLGLRNGLVVIRVSGNSMSDCHRIFLALDAALEINKTQMTTDCWVEHMFLELPQDTSATKSDGEDDLKFELSATLEYLVELT